MSLTMDLSRFGGSVDVTPPPTGKTADLTAQLTDMPVAVPPTPSTGACYHHRISAAEGWVKSDRLSTTC
jgi:hypothetical protein